MHRDRWVIVIEGSEAREIFTRGLRSEAVKPEIGAVSELGRNGESDIGITATRPILKIMD